VVYRSVKAPVHGDSFYILSIPIFAIMGLSSVARSDVGVHLDSAEVLVLALSLFLFKVMPKQTSRAAARFKCTQDVIATVAGPMKWQFPWSTCTLATHLAYSLAHSSSLRP
jgi:hypothetical protein